MKPNIHPELYRAMQRAREEDISRVPARQHTEDHPARSTWVALCGRTVAFFERALSQLSLNPVRQVDTPPNIRVNVPTLADEPRLAE